MANTTNKMAGRKAGQGSKWLHGEPSASRSAARAAMITAWEAAGRP
jgi:hypothetical protein